MTAILDYINKRGFDVYTTNDTIPIYVKKVKDDIKNNICCGYDYTTDELTGLNTYTKCNKQVDNTYLCSDHEEIELNVINEKNKLNVALDENEYWIEDVNIGYFQAMITHYRIDNRLNNSIYIKQQKGKNITQRYRQYLKSTYTFNLNKGYMIVKFWDRHSRLIFKVLKYINVSTGLQDILHIINLFHDTKVIDLIRVSIEPIYFTFKNILNCKLQNRFPSEICNKIVNKFYLDMDVEMIRSFINKYTIFKDNNPYEGTTRGDTRYAEFKFLLHLFKNLLKWYKRPEMKKLYRTMYTRIDENNKILIDTETTFTKEDELECKLLQEEIVRYFELKIENEVFGNSDIL
jgi:hypothetical protein